MCRLLCCQTFHPQLFFLRLLHIYMTGYNGCHSILLEKTEYWFCIGSVVNSSALHLIAKEDKHTSADVPLGSSISKSSSVPDAVKDIPILKYAKQLVICGDLMEVCPLLVCKEQVRLPDRVQHGGVQV